MIKRNTIFYTFVFVLTLAFCFHANAFDQQNALQIDDAMKIAVTTHPAVMAKKNELAAAGFAVDTSKWQRFPAVSAQTSAGQKGQGITTTLVLDQPIWAWGRISSQIDASLAREIAAEAAVLDAQQTILAKVATAYCQTILFKEKMAAADDSILEYNRLYALMTRRTESEVSPNSELIMSRSRLESARSERLQFEASYANAKADLEQLIGEKIEAISYPRMDLVVRNPLDVSVSKALDFSPQIKQAQAQIMASAADIEGKKSAFYPQLSARYQQAWGGNYPANSMYLALSFQPGNGLSALSGVRQAEASKSAAEAAMEASRKDIADKLRTDFNQVVSSLNTSQVYAEYAQSTQSVYESYLRQFTAGRKTWMEVMNARRDATQAKYSLIDSQWSGTMANYRIKIAIGDLNAATLSLRSTRD
jgi:adhesin transport system outer membrane protein